MKFSEYKSRRDDIELFKKFDSLCETIAFSGKGFDDFWLETAMPVLIEGASQTPEETLDLMEFGFLQGIRNGWNNLMNRGSSPAGNVGGDDQGTPAPSTMQQRPTGPAPASDAMRQKAQNIVGPIKQLFAKKISEFTKDAQRLAMNSPNQHHAWKAAELLSNSANRWLQNWMPKVSRAGEGGPEYRQDYQNAYQQHQGGLRRGELARAEAERQQRGVVNGGLAGKDAYGGTPDQAAAAQQRVGDAEKGIVGGNKANALKRVGAHANRMGWQPGEEGTETIRQLGRQGNPQKGDALGNITPSALRNWQRNPKTPLRDVMKATGQQGYMGDQ